MRDETVSREINLGVWTFSIGVALALVGAGIYLQARVQDRIDKNDLYLKITASISSAFKTHDVVKRIKVLEGKTGIADAIGTKTDNGSGKT